MANMARFMTMPGTVNEVTDTRSERFVNHLRVPGIWANLKRISSPGVTARRELDGVPVDVVSP